MIFSRKSYFSDLIGLMGKLTPKRVFNYILNYFSFRLSYLSRNTVVWGKPFSLSFETAAICNLKCPECLAGTGQTQRNNQLMPRDFLIQKLLIHKSTAFWCNLYFQGEPFLHPQIYELIAVTHRQGYYSVISTNGHFLGEQNCHKIIDSRLSKLIVSLDGIDSASYSQYRVKGSFEKVLQGIRNLAGIKKARGVNHPFLEVQFLVNKTNEHQVKAAGNFVKDLGADSLQFKSMQVYSAAGKDSLLPGDKRFNRYSSQRTSKRSGKKCFRLWSHMVYTSDQVMVPCCYDKIPEYGTDASGDDLERLWRSDTLQHFRKKLIQGKELPAICSNCLP